MSDTGDKSFVLTDVNNNLKFRTNGYTHAYFDEEAKLHNFTNEGMEVMEKLTLMNWEGIPYDELPG